MAQNWKGVWSDELSELIEGIDTSQIDELELSDWSKNDFDDTEDFISCEGHEITSETTDEQLEEIQESIESQCGDVYYSGVLQVITEYRDHLVSISEDTPSDEDAYKVIETYLTAGWPNDEALNENALSIQESLDESFEKGHAAKSLTVDEAAELIGKSTDELVEQFKTNGTLF